MSWSLKKILDSYELIADAGRWDNDMKNGEYSIQMLYKIMRGQYENVPWRRDLCGNKALFVTWLAIWRLPTLYKLLEWKIVDVNSCPL